LRVREGRERGGRTGKNDAERHASASDPPVGQVDEDGRVCEEEIESALAPPASEERARCTDERVRDAAQDALQDDELP